MAGLALTDRDGLYGAFKHAQACAAAGIAPVLGANLGHARGPNVTVLAQGKRGWASLCRLLSAGPAPGAEPAAPGAEPFAPGPGLIVLVGPDSDVGLAVAARRHHHALAALNRWRERAETVIEVTDHRGPGDTRRARAMLRLARETGTPAVLTNAVRYLDSGASPVAQVLDAVRRNVPLGTPGLPVHNGQAYLAGPAEMHAVAVRVAGHSDAENLISDTGKLARRCFLDPVRDIGIGSRHLPETKGDLRHITERALADYRGDKDRARRRLDHELDIIARTELIPYFLTVADVTRRIKDRGIRVAIRGSGAGCLVNHLLGISAIDPLEHGLLMERFLSQTRETMPDIDLDVESARRIEVYRIILDAYGENACATVAMMETYRARSAIRDVAAAFGLPPGEIDAIAKAFPHIRAAHIGAALAELPELRDTNLTIAQLTAVFRLAERLDGLPRHVAMHPCGVLLSDQTLRDRTPVTRSSVDDLPLSQLDKDDAEIAGVIKLDVLGVRMQSAMACALTHLPEAVDIDGIPHDDEPTFEMIRQARTIGCFQIESPGQRELVTKVAPRTIGDLIAEISLFRPGPVNSDMITPYLGVRQHRRPASYPHEDLYEALRETGGVVIFHEQVMAVIDTMTGCGLAEADRIRRRLPEGEDAFRAAALGSGYDERTAMRVWEVLAAFGSFGFCKAHAAAFALPVYQSAWLKRHHPAAFYAGVLTHDPGMYPKRVILQDARLAGVQVLSPDVNASAATWTITNGGASPGLRVSLREVKGISDVEVTRIVAGQPYRSLRDFWERARVSRPVAERLISIGAFSSIYAAEITRRDLLARLGILAKPMRHTASRYGASMFDLPGDGFADLVPAGQLRELDQAERIAAELDILGFELDGHVLDRYAALLGELGVVRSDYLRRCQSGAEVLVAGVKVSIQTPAVRSGQRIVFTSLDDAVGLVDLAFFESVQDRCATALFGSWLLLVRGRVRRIGDGVATVSALDCWDLTEVAKTGIPSAADQAVTRTKIRPLEYPNGFVLSPYAETGAPGPPLKTTRRRISRE
jgi:error-prone DNA polymerase